jgi:hypothetical protein
VPDPIIGNPAVHGQRVQRLWIFYKFGEHGELIRWHKRYGPIVFWGFLAAIGFRIYGNAETLMAPQPSGRLIWPRLNWVCFT